ncbi:MAG TPA: UDP-N-acetylmuramoyl-L-alanine--D-glutamate ligase [Candidatus Hydrogenedens sp.]|nr:UDP-N-acetylmuramoyl-L-alanine--D-glutamate ligase [Candidatus Hydrogenedens sp.]
MITSNFTPEKVKLLNRVLIIGAGKSGLASVKLLKKQGKEVIINDIKKEGEIPDAIELFNKLGIDYVLGQHPENLLSKIDFIIVSPGVSPQIPLLKLATMNNIPVIGEFEYAYYFTQSPIIAVTGTNGKTTVTSWIHHTLKELGFSSVLAGNNDTPLSEVIAENIQKDWIVAELSSYQLEYCYYFHPHVAVVLNVTPDHITRHPTMQEYANVKSRIFHNQGENDYAVINKDDKWVSSMSIPPSVNKYYFSLNQKVSPGAWIEIRDKRYIWFDETILDSVDGLPLKGMHNLSNALAVLTSVNVVYKQPARVLNAMSSFKGVPHRIEFLGSKNNVEFYNDSKSTNVESLRVALESFQQPIVLIAGGRGKGSSYLPLRSLIQEKVYFLVTIGEDAENIEKAFSDLVRTERVTTMEEAVKVAWKNAIPQSVILLSPACASFDMYSNYEARGDHFRECVQKLLAEEL